MRRRRCDATQDKKGAVRLWKCGSFFHERPPTRSGIQFLKEPSENHNVFRKVSFFGLREWNRWVAASVESIRHRPCAMMSPHPTTEIIVSVAP